MANWLIPANIKYYDVFGAFSENETYWLTNATVAAGDFVYIYLAAPYKQIGFHCGVKQVGLSFKNTLPHIEQFFREPIGRKKKAKAFMKLQRTVTFQITDGSPLSYDQLKRHGLAGRLMGPRKLENNPKLLEYLKEVCNEL